MLERIVLVGAGRTADSLLPRLVALAPLTVIDSSETALSSLRKVPEADASRVTFRLADGTSRLVLEDVRATGEVGLVAATGSDRQNLEACRLARELGFRPIVGIAIDAASEPAYQELGARAVVRASLLGQVVERAMRYDGLAIATTVGQGDGEIVEFVVLPGSPAIGAPLAELNAEGWRIAAIYRGGRLVIPTGSTTIQPEDRVLLVGAADLVPLVAEQLRVGRPIFPMPHGGNILAYMPAGRDAGIENETEMLAKSTRAEGLVRMWPGAERTNRMLDPTGGGPVGKRLTDQNLPIASIDQHALEFRNAGAGVVATRMPSRTFVEALLGRGGAAAELCNKATVPVMFLQGRTRYERIVHPVLEDVLDERVAYEAIDIARLLSLKVAIVRVTLPEYIASPPEPVSRIVASLERRLRLHEVPFETISLTGNPVRSILEIAKPNDLLVIGRRASNVDSFGSPDVALRVARDTQSSVLVRTLARR